jgi:NADH:ubiquinone oxidoreductase subunit 6 (subunit J)
MKYPMTTLVIVVIGAIFILALFLSHTDFANIPHYTLTAWIFWILLLNTGLFILLLIQLSTVYGGKEKKPEKKPEEKKEPKKGKKQWPPKEDKS